MIQVKKDLTNMVFGRLRVLYQVDDYISPSGHRSSQWKCECSCQDHNIVYATTSNLKRGYIQSCGCYRREFASETHKKQNPIDFCDGYCIGTTLNTGSKFYFDIDDYPLIKDYCWIENIDADGYRSLRAKIRGTNKNIIFHKLLGYDTLTDHIDRNPLNNRRNNLRPATDKENAQNHSVARHNKSGVIGVRQKNNKWIAYIYNQGHQIHIGSFENKKDAIIARLRSEKEYFNEGFEPQRHLFEEYDI